MDELNLNVLKNIVRTGWVSSVNVEERTARVIFQDKGERRNFLFLLTGALGWRKGLLTNRFRRPSLS